MQNSKITELNPLLKQELELLSKKYRSSKSFWQLILDAIKSNSPPYEVHRCSCGELIFISASDAEKMKLDFQSKKSADCWHLQTSDYSLMTLDLDINHRLDQMGYVLRYDRKNTNPYETIFEGRLYKGIFPPNDVISLMYGIHKLQFYIAEDLHSKNKNNDQSTFFNEVKKLFDLALKKNNKEFSKLLEQFKDDEYYNFFYNSVGRGDNTLHQVSQLYENQAYNLLFPSYQPLPNTDDDIDSRAFIGNLNAYKEYFESKEPLILIYNLTKIAQGANFNANPLANKKEDGKLYTKIVIEEINKELKVLGLKKLRTLLNSSYVPEIRNLAGHNEYVWLKNRSDQIKNRSTGKIYDISFIEKTLTNLVKLLDGIYYSRMILLPKVYQKLMLKLSLRGLDSLFWPFSNEGEPLNEIGYRQFWCNAEFDKKMDFIKNPKFGLRHDQKNLYFMLNSEERERPLFIPLNKATLKWIKILYQSEEVKLTRLVISPRNSYFFNKSLGEYKDTISTYFVINEYSINVKLDKEQLKEIIDYASNHPEVFHTDLKPERITSKIRTYVKD